MTLTREQIYTIIREFNCGEGYDAYERANQATDEIWDLVEHGEPGRCAPTVEEVRGAIAAAYPTTAKARAVLALFDSQPTVREAKAEGWDEGYRTGETDWSADDVDYSVTPNPYRSEARHG